MLKGRRFMKNLIYIILAFLTVFFGGPFQEEPKLISPVDGSFARLDGGRTMSRFNTDCLCLACAEAEKYHPRYREAVEAELAEIRKGNYNFKGIGYKL